MAQPTITVRIAFATDPLADTPTWTDVSSDVMSFSTRRGRQHELNREEAGTATVVLLNTSGNYWPDNTGGDYYGNIAPAKKINIRASYDDTINYIGRIDINETIEMLKEFQYLKSGSNTVAVDGGYTDHTQTVIPAGYTAVATTGTATVSGSPVSLSAGTSTVTTSGTGNINITLTPVTYDLFTGYIEAWRPGFQQAPIQGPIMTLQCADGLKLLAGVNLNDGTGYSEEKSGTRIGNVLDDIGWPAADRDIDAGQSDVIATGALVNENAVSHLRDVQNTELGILYVSGAGNMVFQDRHARLVDSTSYTSNATFGDTSGSLGVYRFDLALEDTYIYNDIRVTRDGGTEQAVSDSDSQDDYSIRTLVKSGLLMTSDTEAEDHAGYLLYRWKSPAIRAKSIALKPHGDPLNIYPKALGYELGYRIKVELDQADHSQEYYIEHISHDWKAIDPVGLVTSWGLTYADEVMWLLGDTNFSQLGQTTRLGY